MNIRKRLWSNEMGTKGKCSGVNQELKKVLRQWLHHQTFEFYKARINALIRRWNFEKVREIILRSIEVNLFCIDIT